MLLTLLAMVMLLRLVQASNVQSLIRVMLSGIATRVRLVQPANAASPMLATLLPIVMLLRLVQA